MRRLAALATAVVTVLAVAAAPASAGEVVFASDRCYELEANSFSCRNRIWTVRDDGAGLRRLTSPEPDSRVTDRAPSWSPDGRSAVFTRTRYANDSGTDVRTSLQVVSLDTGATRQVGPELPDSGLTEYVSADWSPAGGSIAFSAGRWSHSFRTADTGIWRIADDGSGLTRLTSGLDDSPRFSPDGSRIAFVRASSEFDKDGNREAPALLAMDPDGSKVAPLFVGEPPRRPGPPNFWYRMAWSPDGRRVAVAVEENLYTVAAGGSRLESHGKLGPVSWRSFGPAFSQLTWGSDAGDMLIYSLPMAVPARPLQRLPLTGTETPATDLAPPIPPPRDHRGNPARFSITGDQAPDWRSSLPAAPAPRDLDPPALVPVDADDTAAAAARASRRRALTVRRRSLGFFAVDVAGVRRVDVAIARKTRVRGRVLCRYVGRRGLGRARSCARAVWRRVRGEPALRRLVRRLPAATYVMRLRGADALGNRTRRPAPVRLRLRR